MQFNDVKLEYPDCLCGESEYITLIDGTKDLLQNLEGEFKVVQCAKCHLIRTYPRPTPQTIGYYYPEGYGPYQQNVSSASTEKSLPSFKKFLIQHFFQVNDKCIPERYSKGNLFEIGCASGVYLKTMHAKGWKVTGVEFSELLATKLQNEGFEVYNGSFDHINLSDRSFDVITAWMVLEHMHDPSQTLQKLHSLLTDDGCFAFSVPDISSIDFKLFGRFGYALQVPTHLFHFNSKSLTHLLEQNGFTVEKILWQQNPNNLLKSMLLYAQHKNLHKIATFLKSGIENNKIPQNVLLLLGYVLKITRLSGRMTVWAKKTI